MPPDICTIIAPNTAIHARGRPDPNAFPIPDPMRAELAFFL